MLRKLILLAAGAAIVGLALFWVLTIPGTVPASALASAYGRISITARPCSLPAAAPPATPHPGRRTSPGSAAGWR